MPTYTTTKIKDYLKYLFFSLVAFFVIFIVKIPVICQGCDPLVGVWYKCIRGTGIGTTTCDIASGVGYALSVDFSALTRTIQESGLANLPREWFQTLASVWGSIRSFGQSLVDQTISLYGYIKEQFNLIVKEYIIGYPKAGYEAFKDNVIIPLISGITNYIINPVKSLILNIVDFKNTALSVLNTVVSTIKGVGGTVYDYTYGFLVDGFDQVPYGLVLFVEGIQYILNGLKTGIISGANSALSGVTYILNLIAQGILGFGKLAVSGTQTTVDGIAYGLESAVNFMIDNVINEVASGLNDAVQFDLGSGIRTGINTLINFINIAYRTVVVPIVDPLIDVIDVVQGGVVTAVNAVSGFDLTGWIPPIDLGVAVIPIPSFKPFSFIGTIQKATISKLSQTLVGELTTTQIPAFSIAGITGMGTIDGVDLIDIPVPNFATSTNELITEWQNDTEATLATVQIPEPEDLFWAGTRPAAGPQGDVCSAIAGAYPLETDSDGAPTKTYANMPGAAVYDQFNTATCLFTSGVQLDNRYIGTSSCSDVCYNYGKSAVDTNDVAGPNCDKQFPLYGRPEAASIPKFTTPNGLTYYVYKNTPVVYFAPNLYKVNITVDLQSFTTTGGKRNYSVDESGMIIIYEPNKSEYKKVTNGGYRNTRTGRFYVLEKDLSSPGDIKAWEYSVNRHTNDTTGCNLEYLLSGSPESLGLESTTLNTGIKVYYIDDQPYIYLNPKLYRLQESTLVPVSTAELTGATSQYSFTVSYSDDKSDQIAIKYNQTGYAYEPSDVVVLPTQFVNNIAVSLTPEQSGFTGRTLGTLYYYVNSNNKPYVYDRSSGKMYALTLNNTDFIVGTPESNSYTKQSFGYSKGGFYRIFAVTEQTQYYVVQHLKGYSIDLPRRVMLPYTVTDNVISYRTPSEAGYVLQPADSNGMIYYSKEDKNFVYDQRGNAMVPLLSLTPSEDIYGLPVDSAYQQRIFGYEKNSQYYHFVTDQRYLIEYFSKSLFSPSCGCTTAFLVTKTCKDYCGSKYDASNSPYGCDDGRTAANTGGYTCSDSRVTDFSKCACTEQGPVNVIVKPMKQYNPFRLLQQGISAGVGELTNLIKYSIQSFLTPIWNAIKSIFQFIASIITTVIQFLFSFFAGGESSPIWGQIQSFIGSLQDGFKEYVIDDFLNGIIWEGIKSIIPTRDQIMSILQPVIDILGIAFDAMLTAFRYAFNALKDAALFLVKTVLPMIGYFIIYLFSLIADTLLFFLPVSRTAKFIIILCILIFFAYQFVPEFQAFVFFTNLIIEAVISTATRLLATGIDLVFNLNLPD
jgi:hypothetical protein